MGIHLQYSKRSPCNVFFVPMEHTLQCEIDQLSEHVRTMVDCNALLARCVAVNDMNAAVFVYDHILQTCGRDDETLRTLLPLHSKTAVDVRVVQLCMTQDGSRPRRRLAARRRIHKILKPHTWRLLRKAE